MAQIFVSAVAHFFVVVGGSKIHERPAHFFIDIYTFYLNKSLGEFAFSKIEAAINNLQTLKKTPDDSELRDRCREYKHIINIIGEPIIKQKLQALYDELFDTESDTAYKHQLEELYHILNTRDPQKQEKYKTLLAKTLSKMKEN